MKQSGGTYASIGIVALRIENKNVFAGKSAAYCIKSFAVNFSNFRVNIQ
jgi:hypothetical protein